MMIAGFWKFIDYIKEYKTVGFVYISSPDLICLQCSSDNKDNSSDYSSTHIRFRVSNIHSPVERKQHSILLSPPLEE